MYRNSRLASIYTMTKLHVRSFLSNTYKTKSCKYRNNFSWFKSRKIGHNKSDRNKSLTIHIFIVIYKYRYIIIIKHRNYFLKISVKFI